MADMTPPHDTPLLAHAVSWTSGEPRLIVSHPIAAERVSFTLIGQRLAFSVDATGRWCTGRFVALSADDGRHEPCPGSRLATNGGQCEQCAAQDDSRFMHHAHRGGYVPEALNRYLAQPHWLYIATFADGTSKVGTASDLRKRIRLDEQGAVRATYVARAADGRAVRVLEDAVTEHCGIPQTKHKSSKAAALTRALAPSVLDARHSADVESTASLLRGHDAPLVMEAWQPPSAHAAFFAHTGVHPLYPHSLAAGDHCITPHAMVGGVALASVNDAAPTDGEAGAHDVVVDDGLFLLDLDRLRGRRLTFGAFRSPESSAQHSLF